MHHAPRATRQLRFDAKWESPKLPKLPFHYSCGICGKCGKQCAWAEGVTILLLSFLGFKIPRPSAESFLLRIYLKVRAHNTVCPSVARISTTFLALYLWDGKE